MSDKKEEVGVRFIAHVETVFVVMLICMVVVFFLAIAYQNDVKDARAIMSGGDMIGIQFWTAIIGFLVGLLGSYIAESDSNWEG